MRKKYFAPFLIMTGNWASNWTKAPMVTPIAILTMLSCLEKKIIMLIMAMLNNIGAKAGTVKWS